MVYDICDYESGPSHKHEKVQLCSLLYSQFISYTRSVFQILKLRKTSEKTNKKINILYLSMIKLFKNIF